MCGRQACNQCKETYVKATSYYEDGKYLLPKWKPLPNSGVDFVPSTNIAPSEAAPVLLGSGFLDESSLRSLAPMVWGVIPPWHKGNFRTHGLTTNNCRIETISTSKLYSPLLRNGNRCVVIADGFYEWQTTNKAKQPYFIYASQKDQVKVEEVGSWERGEWNEETGWTGPQPLCMAGLYSKWTSDQEEEVYSYTVITKESDKGFSWLHHRVPAFLSTSQQIKDWLNSKFVGKKEALGILNEPTEKLSWHPVSTTVNNAKNKAESCNKRIKLKNTLLTSWLQKPQQSKDETEPKRMKLESP